MKPGAARPIAIAGVDPPRVHSGSLGMVRALVVESDPEAGAYVAARLRSADVISEVVRDGREASVSLEARLPDLILLAADLSDGDGLDLLQRLRERPRLQHTPVALMATFAVARSVLGRALELGADDVLRKPVDPIELIARVRALVRLRRRFLELQQKTARLEELNRELARAAVRDPLTSAYNRRYLEQRLADEVDRARRYAQTLSILMVDVDHFKHINDQHGHAVGDAILRAIASVLQRAIRQSDLLARYGGEEFVIVTPSTASAGACVLAERIRAKLADAPLIATTGSGLHATLRVSASFGVATLRTQREGFENSASLLERADAALYEAKHRGRNCVVCGDG